MIVKWDLHTGKQAHIFHKLRADKGKGKAAAKGPRMLGDDAISTMTQAQMTAEIKELEGLKEDLALKVRSLHAFLLRTKLISGIG